MKLYDRKEISAILKKASKNSATDDTQNPTGLSLNELRQLASDVGINPEQIDQAIAEIEEDSAKSERNFWGGPFSYSSQVVVEGEISVGQWEEMLVSIRNFFQSKGEVTTRESVFEWSSPWGTTNSAQVTALKDKGKTKISVGWNGPLTAVPFYVPVPLVAIASVFFASEFLALTSVPGIAFTLMTSAITFLVGRWALIKHMDNGFKKFGQMIAGLDRIASAQKSAEDLDVKQEDSSQIQGENSSSLLKIDEEEKYNNTDMEATRRNRTKE
jgi:hypothetical protein